MLTGIKNARMKDVSDGKKSVQPFQHNRSTNRRQTDGHIKM